MPPDTLEAEAATHVCEGYWDLRKQPKSPEDKESTDGMKERNNMQSTAPQMAPLHLDEQAPARLAKPATRGSSPWLPKLLTAAASLAACLLATTARAEASFSDGFEGGSLNPFWSKAENNGSVTVPSTTRAHSGTQSLELRTTAPYAPQKQADVHHQFGAPVYGTFSVWVYDTMVNETLSNYAWLTVWNIATGSRVYLMTENFWNSFGDHYVYDVGQGNIRTSLPRTRAWHHWVIAALPNSLTLSIDDAVVYQGAGGLPFDYVELAISGGTRTVSYSVQFDDFEFNSATTLTNIQVLPADPVISTAQVQQFTAVGVMADGSFTNLSAAAPASWTRLQPTGTLPARRAAACSIYDPTHNVLVVHGGNPNLCTFDPLYSDVWKLSNANGLGGTPTWIQLLPAGTAPAARQGHKGVYNAVTDRMVFFGGDLTCGCSKLSDLWVLTNATARAGSPGWVQLTPAGGPPTERSDQAAVYDAANNRMTIFGGFDCTAGNLNDAWVLSNADGSTGTPQWTQLTPAGTAPTGRLMATGVYDPASNRMMIFGGTTCCPSTRLYFNDVWMLTYANNLGGTPQWVQLSPTGTLPSGRCGQVAEYDPATKRMIVFGGGGSYTPYYGNDVWVLSNADGTSGTPKWSQLVAGGDTPVGRGRENGQPASAYDPASNRLVIFGGGTGLTPSTTNDTYVLSTANGGVFWSSGNTNVATINWSGLATPAIQGMATITATYGALSGSTTLLVTNIPPTFTSGLINHSVGLGGTVTFTNAVSGSQPMTCVWSLNGTVIPGATGSSLTVTNIGPSTVGLYTVTVTNPGGSATSSGALSLVDLKMYAGLNIYGPVPANYRIDVQNTLGGTNVWAPLETITATNNPYFYLDTNSPSHWSRFYRAVWLP